MRNREQYVTISTIRRGESHFSLKVYWLILRTRKGRGGFIPQKGVGGKAGFPLEKGWKRGAGFPLFPN